MPAGEAEAGSPWEAICEISEIEVQSVSSSPGGASSRSQLLHNHGTERSTSR
jgi:hypothetical protein